MSFPDRPVIFTALSKYHFYARYLVCRYAFEHGVVPVNPFTLFGFFLNDQVDRDLVRTGNMSMLRRCDELWVFGPIPNGVLAEIDEAIEHKKPIKFFSIGSSFDKIKPLNLNELEFEPDAFHTHTKEEIMKRIEENTIA